MSRKIPTLKYLAVSMLVLVLGGGIYLAGKTPEVVEAAIQELVSELQKKHGIRLQLGKISIEGFLTARVDNFILEKKSDGLYVQAVSIKARLSPLGYLLDGNPVSRLEIDTLEVMAKVDYDVQDSTAKSFKPEFTLNELIINNGRADINLNGKILQIIELAANAKITPKLIDLRILEIQTPELRVGASGKMLFGSHQHLGLGSDLRLSLSGKLQEIPEIRLLKIPLKADINLFGHVRYPDIARGFEFEGEAKIRDILIDNVEIASLSGGFFVNQKGLQISKAKVGFAGTQIDLAGQLQFDRELHFAGQVAGKNVSLYELLDDLDVKKSWVDLKLNTQGYVRGQVNPIFSLAGHASGTASGLTVQDRKSMILQTAYPIQFDMDLGANPEAFEFRRAKFNDGRSQLVANCDLFFKKPGMWLEGDISQIDFKSIKNRIAGNPYEGSGEAKVKIEGPYDNLKIEAPLIVQDFRFEKIPFGAVQGDFEFQQDQILIKNIKATKKSVNYTGDLVVSLGTPVRIDTQVSIQGGLVKDLLDTNLPGSIEGTIQLDGPVEKGYRSELSAHAKLLLKSGARNSQMDLDLNHGQGSLKASNSALGDFQFGLAIENDRINAQGKFEVARADSKLVIDLKDGVPFALELSMPYGPLASLLPNTDFVSEWSISSGLNLSAKGKLAEIENTIADVSFSPATFYAGNLKFIASTAIAARYEDKLLVFSPMLLKSVHGDEIKLEGKLDSLGPDLRIKTNLDLWALTYLDDRIQNAYGNFQADVRAQGLWDSLKFFGQGRIADGSYVSLRDYPPGLTDLSGIVEFEGERAELKLTGLANHGQFNLGGFLNLTERSFENIRVDLVKMPVYYSTFLTGISNGFLELEGSWKEPSLTGDVQFSQMLITKELYPTEFKAPRSRVKKQTVKLDIALSATESVRVESKSLNAELSGKLNLVGTTNSLGLTGELTVVSGEAYFRSHYFHIVKARANFDNPFRIAPYIDVEANSQILNYDVTVRAQGDLAHPKLLFSSKPALSQADLFSLITFGFSNRDYQDNIGVARSAGLEALSMVSGVGDRVLKLLPAGSFDELRLGTLYNQNGGVTPSVVLGMQAFKNMRLRFQSSLIQDNLGNREKRLELEKYINRRWRWRLIWDSEGVTNWGDAGADLWIRWDY